MTKPDIMEKTLAEAIFDEIQRCILAGEPVTVSAIQSAIDRLTEPPQSRECSISASDVDRFVDRIAKVAEITGSREVEIKLPVGRVPRSTAGKFRSGTVLTWSY